MIADRAKTNLIHEAVCYIGHGLATCPHCKGHLTDGHRCPRRRSFVIIEIVASAMVGGLGGLLLLAAFDPFGQIGGGMDVTTVIVGMLVAVGINRFIRS
jgi:hypothetical protein